MCLQKLVEGLTFAILEDENINRIFDNSRIEITNDVGMFKLTQDLNLTLQTFLLVLIQTIRRENLSDHPRTSSLIFSEIDGSLTARTQFLAENVAFKYFSPRLHLAQSNNHYRKNVKARDI